MKDERRLIRGNEAVAEGAIQAGCRYYFGYPITPQNEIPEYLARELPKIGGVFIQAESEIAAINMVMGASAAGARVMTSSSGPGISLMQEGMSYMAGAELPALVVNVMRTGPGLGGIAPTQADYFQATRGGGHGDYYNIVLAPASVQEMFDLTIKAFQLADEYRNPAMVLADAMLGQMKEPALLRPQEEMVSYPKPWALKGCQGREPQVLKTLYFRDPGGSEAHNVRLRQKYQRIREEVAMWEERDLEEAETVIVAYGSASRICKSALKLARQEGIRVGLIRPITLFPFPVQALEKASSFCSRFLVVEMSNGQMVEDVCIALKGRGEVSFYGTPGGATLSPENIYKEIKKYCSSLPSPDLRLDYRKA